MMTDKILFLAGSPTDDFHADLSRVYAGDALAALRECCDDDFTVAWVSPDGRFAFPDDLNLDSISDARSMTLVEAMAKIVEANFDVVVPQMFCAAGMTRYRGLVETLGIPLVGNDATTMAITMDKSTTRAIAAAAGIRLPAGQTITRVDDCGIDFPIVVKPATGDNSHGVALVSSAGELQRAFNAARAYGDRVIVEQFIPLGREVRCGTIVRDGSIECLPLQEYRMDAVDQPIRGRASKLMRTADGQLDLTSKYVAASWFVDRNDPLTDAVWSVAKRCHQALRCRDYGLFDFRIDPAGKPYFLEAGLYNSFAPKSVVTSMAAEAGIGLRDLFRHCVDLARLRDTRQVDLISRDALACGFHS